MNKKEKRKTNVARIESTPFKKTKVNEGASTSKKLDEAEKIQ